ncbi:hypothetical protein POL68_28380 [Stigmatella sp. ncwal1]|uniref:TIGR02678 family protein n=1 Tax=Stigmatella ashevillensis TaxID=2995309 RepID=A0ABT5DI18_9BACT|nr:hypothetical protein [Stigmatella ashevillena]MDC0712413.1 hypothetical protein [Stigmatella ashevillena]
MATHPDILRERLEDRADLLEASRLRYRALRGILSGFFWKERLRANLELLREVARVQPEVDAALAAASRRAAAESWPRESAPVRLLDEVRHLREAVAQAVKRRLAAREPPALLGEAMLALEEAVLATGPLLGGRTWARAVEILPRNLPELRAACAAAGVFEAIFKRPLPKGVLPFSAAEANELGRALPLGEVALRSLWERLDRFDETGRVRPFLDRKVRQVPGPAPRSGPELLLHAAFWYDVARVRLGELLEARLDPVVARDEEVPVLLAWLVAREDSPEARLEAGEVLGEGRAGLFELAIELALLSRGRPEGAWNEEAAWVRLWTAAHRARDEAGEDVERVREALLLFIRLRGRTNVPARLFSPDQAPPIAPVGPDLKDLPGLVQAAREAAR